MNNKTQKVIIFQIQTEIKKHSALIKNNLSKKVISKNSHSNKKKNSMKNLKLINRPIIKIKNFKKLMILCLKRIPKNQIKIINT